MVNTKSLEKTVLTLLEEKKYKELKDIFAHMNPVDIAALLEGFSEKNYLLLFRILPKDLAAETFVEMDYDQQEILIGSFSDSELREVVNELYIDDMVDIVEEMPANVVKRILASSDANTRKLINEILKYPPDSAGSIMTTEFINLHADMTVAEAIKRIREKGFDSETIDTCYVTDNVRHLIGFVTIRTIILSDENSKIEDVMNRNVISVGTMEDQETVVNLFAKYDLTVLPVVDNEKRIVGIVTVDDAIDVLQKETTEDFEKMAAITPTDRPYLKKTTYEIWKSRIPWLLILMISATFTGMIISHFEEALKTYVILTAYIPMLMDTGGNSGSQASVTIIRSLSLNELHFGDILRVLWKEFRVALMSGITLALVYFAKLIIFDKTGIAVASIICVTLVLTVFVAKLVGCFFPMLAKKVGFDPAVMASPFITTIVDAISLLIYFNIASAILGI
ncbi:MAG: magnesium transporter [Clostridiaceae bacterium]|nr:magnesium transporter [Clostridiaceae bacterium]